MESVVLLGLMGVGYLMNKDDDKEKHRIDTNIQPKVFQNTNSSIYNLLAKKLYKGILVFIISFNIFVFVIK